MSKTISAVVIQLLVIFLPMIGVRVGDDQVTVMVQTLTVIGAGLWIWVERVKKGGVNFFGKRI